MKRNVSMKAIPVLTRDLRSHHGPFEISEDASSVSDCFTSTSLISSASCGSLSSSSSRVYPVHANDRKVRLTPPPVSGTPEWYIKKFHDQKVSSKQLTTLQTALQGRDIEWIKRFVELGGMSVIARWLYQMNRKSPDAALEYEVVKCLTYILNHRSATVSALSQGANETVAHIASALDTPHLPTRRLLLDILVFLVYWKDGANYQTVITGLESLSEDTNEAGNAYAYWFQSLQTVLAGRGKMGSKVGASEDFKRSGGEPDGILTEYLMSNILLMNGIMQAIDDLDIRLHHRSQMETCGLQEIIKLARACDIATITKLLDLLQQTLDEDERSLTERMQYINTCDMGSLDDVHCALRAKTKGSERAETYLLSILQHLLLIHQDGPELVHVLQLIDSIVADVVMDKKLGAAGKRLGLSVERIVGQMEQVERARTAEEELITVRSAALHLKIEKEALEDRAAHAENLVTSLQAEVSQLKLEQGKTPSASNTPYKDRIAQLADILPGSGSPLAYVSTSTPHRIRRSPLLSANAANKVPVVPAGRQPFWGITSWFGLGENGNMPDVPGPQQTMQPAGLGFTDMKDDVFIDHVQLSAEKA